MFLDRSYGGADEIQSSLGWLVGSEMQQDNTPTAAIWTASSYPPMSSLATIST
jgi:hypothetical protein